MLCLYYTKFHSIIRTLRRRKKTFILCSWFDLLCPVIRILGLATPIECNLHLFSANKAKTSIEIEFDQCTLEVVAQLNDSLRLDNI